MCYWLIKSNVLFINCKPNSVYDIVCIFIPDFLSLSNEYTKIMLDFYFKIYILKINIFFKIIIFFRSICKTEEEVNAFVTKIKIEKDLNN